MTFEEQLKKSLYLFEYKDNIYITKEDINKRYKVLAKKYHPDTSLYKDGIKFKELIDAKTFLIKNINYINNLYGIYKEFDTKEELYDEAIKYFNSDKYDLAYKLFDRLNDYKDSKKLKEETLIIIESINNKIYERALILYNKKKYFKSLKLFNKIIDYKDSYYYIEDIKKKRSYMYSFSLLVLGLFVTILLILSIYLITK